jgi:hypothetical protein
MQSIIVKPNLPAYNLSLYLIPDNQLYEVRRSDTRRSAPAVTHLNMPAAWPLSTDFVYIGQLIRQQFFGPVEDYSTLGDMEFGASSTAGPGVEQAGSAAGG